MSIETAPSTNGESGAEKKQLLSPREHEVAELIILGKTDDEIAIILNFKPRTSRFHVENIKSKLGVSTRIQAALVYDRMVRPEGSHETLATLTKRQKEVMDLVIQGKTDDEIGKIFNCRSSSIRAFVDGVKLRFKVGTRTQAAIMYDRVARAKK